MNHPTEEYAALDPREICFNVALLLAILTALTGMFILLAAICS